MKCPVCGTNPDSSVVGSTYKWRNGLPKSFGRNGWQYFTCNRCFIEREKLGKELLCCFVFIKDKIYVWVHSISKWQSFYRFYLNPSRRDNILGDFINEQNNEE
jgi:hypothetical protein